MYLSIDLDDPTPDRISECWMRCVNKGITNLQGRVSSGKRGIHITGEGNEEEVEILRGIFDDPLRVKFDRERKGKPSQILFDRKGDMYAGKWYRSLKGLLNAYRHATDVPQSFGMRGCRYHVPSPSAPLYVR